jgi:pimeloyl-ACP methyl ester carboxylesterase
MYANKSHLPQPNPPLIKQIPGYGKSTPSPTSHDKRTIGLLILHALHAHLSPSIPYSQPLILGGHDRGARICHRLAVDFFSLHPFLSPLNFTLSGTILLDIVPNTTQWLSFARPSAAVRTFHWPFLASAHALPMITAFGGDKFVEAMIYDWGGKSEESVKKLNSDGALEVYRGYFRDPSVIQASCDDYAAGADADVAHEQEDQTAGRKMGVDTLVLYSAGYLGSQHDVLAVWKEWVQDVKVLTTRGIEDVGHFLAEEAPVETAREIERFWSQVVGRIRREV